MLIYKDKLNHPFYRKEVVVTYAHSHQNSLLPRLVNGTARHYFDSFEEGIFSDVDECGICPFYGPPAIVCDLHGYVYSREQHDRDYYVQPRPLSFEDQWREAKEHTDDGDYYAYIDDFDRADDAYEEVDEFEHELADFYEAYLHQDAPNERESWWQEEGDRYYDAKRKRAYRRAIAYSPSHRRRDLSIHARGRRFGEDSRRYRNAGVRTPYRAYVAKKEAAI